MLEIKSLFGSWHEATKEMAAKYYEHFCSGSVTIDVLDKHKFFNENHIRGGHVLLNGTVETDEEKEERVFNHYKNGLKKMTLSQERLRFACIEYVCSFTNIDPYKMAAILIRDGIKILYDDASISQKENAVKERKVRKLMAV